MMSLPRMSCPLVAALVLLGPQPRAATAQGEPVRSCRPMVAYDSPEGLFLIEPGAEAPRPVNSDLLGPGSGASKPHLSPDGLTLAWVRYLPEAGLGPDIWLRDVDGEGVRPLTPGVTSDQPAWSPDGTRIAFTSQQNGNGDLYVIGVDGQGMRRLTRHPARDEYAAWSPDGERIAFGSLRNGNFDVFIMRSDGSELQQVTSHPAVDFRPAWSPDGEWLAFSSSRADSTSMRTFNYDIYVMRPDGSDVRRITYHPLLALRPSWSPEGNELVYQVGGQADDGSDWEIYSVRLDGGQPRRLTNNSLRDAHPDWNTFQLACRRR